MQDTGYRIQDTGSGIEMDDSDSGCSIEYTKRPLFLIQIQVLCLKTLRAGPQAERSSRLNRLLLV